MTASTTPPEMVNDGFQPMPGSALRGYLVVIPAILYVAIYLLLLLLFALLIPPFVRKFQIPLIRGWGRGPLILFGIKIEEHGKEIRDTPGAKLLLFNHVNIFDLLVLAATWTNGSTIIYKQEFNKIPVMGRLMRFFKMISVDRTNHEKAVQSLNLAAQLITEKGHIVVMAPEGTRSTTGKMAAFKKGPFHLAIQTGVPIVPMVQRGSEKLSPGGTLIARSGRLRIDYLPAIPTVDWNRKQLSTHTQHVREQFLKYLEDGSN
ncbi:MAG: 1-acyl-sn-glycerol-3-phosphate acyltransferase [Planctomycetes bacterium]|nr:1-acyl-sn-glycerol-3-phosphate acyltransferase [Planctomycetota bacterium]